MLIRQGHSKAATRSQPTRFLEATAERIVFEMEFIPITLSQFIIRPWYLQWKIHQGYL